MSSIRTVIVDDERRARQRIRRMLAEQSDVAVMGEFAQAESAAEFLGAERD